MKRKMTPLREFKTRALIKLADLCEQLRSKYPDRSARASEVCDDLAKRVVNLRAYSLAYFTFLVIMYSKEFPELACLTPTHADLEKLETSRA